MLWKKRIAIKNIVTPPLSSEDKPIISFGDDSMVHVRWDKVVLEFSEGPAGLWQTEEGESSMRFDITEGINFFRLRAEIEAG